MLYVVFLNAPRTSIDLAKPVPGPHVDGVIRSIFYSMRQIFAHLRQLIITSQAPSTASGSTKASSLKNSTDVITMKST